MTDLAAALKKARAKIKKLKEENAELTRLFDLQHTRVNKAAKLWQKETGKHDTLPDLGKLVDWLLKKIKKP